MNTFMSVHACICMPVCGGCVFVSALPRNCVAKVIIGRATYAWVCLIFFFVWFRLWLTSLPKEWFSNKRAMTRNGNINWDKCEGKKKTSHAHVENWNTFIISVNLHVGENIEVDKRRKLLFATERQTI